VAKGLTLVARGPAQGWHWCRWGTDLWQRRRGNEGRWWDGAGSWLATRHRAAVPQLGQWCLGSGIKGQRGGWRGRERQRRVAVSASGGGGGV
jgi:hypothetical protein